MRNKLLIYFSYLHKLFLQNRSTRQTVFKNTFWLIAAEGISKFLLFIITVMVTRYLGVDNYGKYTFAFAFVSLFGMITDFGFNTLTIREISKNKTVAKKYIENILVIKFILGIITFISVFIVIQFIAKTSEIRTLVYLAAIFTIIQDYVDFFQSIYQAYEKMQHSFIIRVLTILILLILVLTAIKLKLSMSALVVANIISYFTTFIIGSLLIQKFFTSFHVEIDLVFWKKIAKEAWPFLGGLICMIVYYNSDSVLISIFRDYKEVGLYQAAYKVFFVFQTLNFVHQALYPRLAKLYEMKEYHKYKVILKRLFIYSIIFFIPFGLITTLLSKNILLLIYGNAFKEAYFALIILIWTEIIIYFAHFWHSSITISNNQKSWFYSALIGAIFNFCANLIIIPRFGYVGASITTLFSEILVTISLYYYSPKQLRNFFF